MIEQEMCLSETQCPVCVFKVYLQVASASSRLHIGTDLQTKCPRLRSFEIKFQLSFGRLRNYLPLKDYYIPWSVFFYF